MSSLNFKPITLAGWACQEGRIGTICWQGYNLFTRPTGDVETRGHALLSAAPFMRGLPMFPRHSQSSQECSAFFFFCKNAAPPKFVSCLPVPSCRLAAPSEAKWKGSCWLPQPPTTTPEKWDSLILSGLRTLLLLPSVFYPQLWAETSGSTLTRHIF